MAMPSLPIICTCVEAGHEGGKGGHSSRRVLAELSSEPFVLDVVPKRRYGFGIQTIYDLILLGEEPVPEFPG